MLKKHVIWFNVENPIFNLKILFLLANNFSDLVPSIRNENSTHSKKEENKGGIKKKNVEKLARKYPHLILIVNLLLR